MNKNLIRPWNRLASQKEFLNQDKIQAVRVEAHAAFMTRKIAVWDGRITRAIQKQAKAAQIVWSDRTIAAVIAWMRARRIVIQFTQRKQDYEYQAKKAQRGAISAITKVKLAQTVVEAAERDWIQVMQTMGTDESTIAMMRKVEIRRAAADEAYTAKAIQSYRAQAAKAIVWDERANQLWERKWK